MYINSETEYEIIQSLAPIVQHFWFGLPSCYLFLCRSRTTVRLTLSSVTHPVHYLVQFLIQCSDPFFTSGCVGNLILISFRQLESVLLNTLMYLKQVNGLVQ
jgi:hypothetical protein